MIGIFFLFLLKNPLLSKGFLSVNDKFVKSLPHQGVISHSTLKNFLVPIHRLTSQNSHFFSLDFIHNPYRSEMLWMGYIGGVFDPVGQEIVFVPYDQGLARPNLHVYEARSGKIRAYAHNRNDFVSGAYRGGVFDPVNGKVIFMPYQQGKSNTLHRYNGATRTIESYAGFSTNADFAYFGGVFDPIHANIIFAPSNIGNASNPNIWHYYDCNTQSIQTYSPGSLTEPPTDFRYMAGSYDPLNRQIVFAPNHKGLNSYLHIYNCMDQSIEEVLAPVAPASYLYLGSFYDYQNQRIVFIPNSTDVSQNLVFYDCVNKTFDTYSSNINPTEIAGGFSNWGGAYHIGLNYFFLSPYNQRNESFFHYYDPRSRNFQKYEKPSAFTGLHGLPPLNSGAVYNPHNGGEIIFINGDNINVAAPESSRGDFLRLRTFPPVSVDPFLASHYLFSAGF